LRAALTAKSGWPPGAGTAFPAEDSALDACRADRRGQPAVPRSPRVREDECGLPAARPVLHDDGLLDLSEEDFGILALIDIQPKIQRFADRGFCCCTDAAGAPGSAPAAL
jgi:hypothetical protein